MFVFILYNKKINAISVAVLLEERERERDPRNKQPMYTT